MSEPKLMSAEELARLRVEWNGWPGTATGRLLAHIAAQDQRIGELKSGLVDALYWLKPGLADRRLVEVECERDRLSNLLDEEERKP